MKRPRKAIVPCGLLHALLGFALALAAVPTARADYAVLRNGQRLHITGYERKGGSIELRVDGGRVVVPAADVAAFEPEDLFPPLVQAVPPVSPVPFEPIIRSAAQKHGVDSALVASVIQAESNFHPQAVSRKHAEGLMQLMPATAARFAVTNAFDPAQNVEAGTQYLKELLGEYHQNVPLALAAYNAGPGRVNQYHGVPPFPETRAYIGRVARGFAERKNSSPDFRAMVCPPLRASCEEASAGTSVRAPDELSRALP